VCAMQREEQNRFPCLHVHAFKAKEVLQRDSTYECEITIEYVPVTLPCSRGNYKA